MLLANIDFYKKKSSSRKLFFYMDTSKFSFTLLLGKS